MSWILQKKQRSEFSFTEYCPSERDRLMKCLAIDAA